MRNTHAARRAGHPSTKGKTRALNLGARSDRLTGQSSPLSHYGSHPLTAIIFVKSFKTHAFKLANNKYVAC